MPFIQYTSIQEDGSTSVEWTPYPKPKFRFKKAFKPSPPFSIDEEVIAILTEWYTIRGLSVPPDELDACRGADAHNAKEHENQMAAPVQAVKPVYGTPEFWKDWWKKKKAKDEAAAQVLAKAQAEFAKLSTQEA